MSQPQLANDCACADRQRLSGAVRDAVNDILALQTQKRISVMNGDLGDLIYIGRAFDKAFCKWECARLRYQVYAQKHGC